MDTEHEKKIEFPKGSVEDQLDQLQSAYMKASNPHDAGVLLGVHDLIAIQNGKPTLNFSEEFFETHHVGIGDIIDGNGYDMTIIDIIRAYSELYASGKKVSRMPDEDALEYLIATHVLEYDKKTDMYTNVKFDINDSCEIWTAFWAAHRNHRKIYFEAIGEALE